jgi:hypothetical protein
MKFRRRLFVNGLFSIILNTFVGFWNSWQAQRKARSSWLPSHEFACHGSIRWCEVDPTNGILFSIQSIKDKVLTIMTVGNHGSVPWTTGLMQANWCNVGDVSLGRYNRTPRMRVQKAENVNKALEFITSRGVKLTNIGPEGASLWNGLDNGDLNIWYACRYHRR